MAKTLIAFYSRCGENWVDGSIRNLPKGNNEVIVEKIKALLPEADVFRIDTVKKYSDDYMVCIEEAKLTAGVAIHGAAASHCDREVNLILDQAR